MIRPFGTRILIRPVEAPTVSRGGIALPPSAQVAPPSGTILAYADPQVLHPLPVGALVFYTPYAGFPVTVTAADGTVTDYLVIQESDIVAVDEPGPTPTPEA